MSLDAARSPSMPLDAARRRSVPLDAARCRSMPLDAARSLCGVPFPHHLLVELADAGLRQGFHEDNPIRDAVAGNNSLFDKALKMGPDLLFADLLAALCNQEPERPLDPFWIRHADYGRFSHARVPEDQVLKPETEVEK